MGLIATVVGWSTAVQANILVMFYGRPQRLSPWPCPQGQLYQVHTMWGMSKDVDVSELRERLTLECRTSPTEARWVLQVSETCQIPESPRARVAHDCRNSKVRNIRTERGYYLLKNAYFGQQCFHLSLDDLDRALPGLGEQLGERLIWGSWICRRVIPLASQRVDLVAKPQMVVKTSTNFEREPFSDQEIDYLIYHFSVMLSDAEIRRVPTYR
ncbi:MAG: hypothetical protein NZL92_11525 [Gloeomargarita sp. SKYG116]|nr:hypothetical protein [Gloeomargarita sp. SKYG116]MDW8402312.1 hypothetical protein [Gloeomargarita sp. SKYGB_i_bin116]